MDEQQHRLHFELFNQVCDLILPMPGTACSVVALLPAARIIVHAMANIATKAALSNGHHVSCGPGCGACCRQLVPISAVEATALVRAIDARPSEQRDRIRNRFSHAVHQMEMLGMLDRSSPRPRLALRGHGKDSASLWLDVSQRYFNAAIACPVLEDEACSLYADRPLVCRAYNVTSSPESCRRLDGGAEALPRPINVESALAKTAHVFDGSPPYLIPLTLAVEWADSSPGAFAEQRDGEALLARLIEELTAHCEHEPGK